MPSAQFGRGALAICAAVSAGTLFAAAPCAGQPAGAPSGKAQAEPAPGARLVYGAEFFAPNRPDTAYDMILLLPGFTFEEGDQVRGFAGAAANVLIDGRRPSSKLDLVADLLKRIPASSVARVEIIRGGAPGIDMQGRSVLANVVRRAAVTSQLTANATALLYGDRHSGKNLRLDWTRREGETGLDASIQIFKQQNPNSGEGRRTLTTAQGDVVSDAQARITEPTDAIETRAAYQRPLLGGLLRLKGAFTYGTDHLVEADTIFAGSIGPHRNARTSTFRTRNGEFSVDFTRQLTPAAKFEVIGLQTLERAEDVGDALQDGVSENTRATGFQGESIARATVTYSWSDALSLESGGEYDFNFLNGTDALKIGGVGIPLPSADVRVTEGRAEVFGTATWKPLKSLDLDAGARIESSTLRVSGDAHNATSFLFVKPRATATWTPFGEDQVRLRVERTVSQLDFQNFVTVSTLDTNIVTAGNPRLVPEQDWIAEAAYEHHFWRTGVAVITLSHAELEDVIDDVPVDGFSAPGNIGRGTRDTAALDLTVPLGRLGMTGGLLKAGALWKFSQVTDPTTHERRQISLDQPFSGTLALSNELPRLKSSWRLDVTGGYRQPTFLIDEVQRARFQTQVGFLWEYKPRSDLSLQAQVQNLGAGRRFRTRQIFDGVRSLGDLAFIERLAIANHPRLLLNLRKSF
jgi:hypothetical protein